jgi:aerobic-type carbon monoxide dehydrogenase small subunit (CoxS/CutS family)
VQLTVNGRQVEVAADLSLLEALRDEVGLRSPKDGCSPQGQCGCCTVLVDDQPRVACVTPSRRVAGRDVRTVEGFPPDVRARWADAFVACGASQCGFCTPGIVVRLEGLRSKSGGGAGADDGPVDDRAVEKALLPHLCRCTGWRTIVEAYRHFELVPTPTPTRDLTAAARRAAIEGGVEQSVGPAVVLGDAGFSDDVAPHDALVAVPDQAGGWAIGETVHEARAKAGKVQGRRTTADGRPPLALPEGDWPITLQTSWVEPAYLEVDASWCEPGGDPASPLANGGAFGGKAASIAPAVARRLADEHGRPVRVLLSREDAVRMGPKRPPIAGGVRADGTGVIRVVATAGIVEAIASVAPGLIVDEIVVPGPPTSNALRAAGWAEAVALLAAVRGEVGRVTAPSGGIAEASVGADGGVHVWVSCGDVLDEVVLRSYCIGAAHMALGLVTSEQLTVDEAGTVHDLTIRSFGVLRASDTPSIDIDIDDDARGVPVNGSDAVFAAVAAAVWLHQGCPPSWPTGVAVRR